MCYVESHVGALLTLLLLYFTVLRPKPRTQSLLFQSHWRTTPQKIILVRLQVDNGGSDTGIQMEDGTAIVKSDTSWTAGLWIYKDGQSHGDWAHLITDGASNDVLCMCCFDAYHRALRRSFIRKAHACVYDAWAEGGWDLSHTSVTTFVVRGWRTMREALIARWRPPTAHARHDAAP